MAEDEDAPRRKLVHLIGEALDDLAIRDFDQRIALLQGEIDRLQAAKRRKQAAVDHAGSVFKS